jgi:imidazolonepropionase-like amidohydrolase
MLVANSRRLRDAGVAITAGSDAGIGPIKPPDVLRCAVGQLGQLGMSGAAALRACTSEAAAVCGLGHRKGRLAPGYDADILAVQGDPAREHRTRSGRVRPGPARHLPSLRSCRQSGAYCLMV